MASTKRMKKRGKSAHRLDLTPLKEALKDRRCWTCLAICAAPEGEDSHFEILTDEDNNPIDILVDVITQPDELELTCRLGGMSAIGILTVPAIGDEVLVCLPGGQIDFMPTIVALMSTGRMPKAPLQGPAPLRTLIVNFEVLVHDGLGGAEELAYKSDVQAVRDELHEHEHDYIPGSSGTATTTGGPSVTAPVGTSVLKAR